MVIVSSFTSLAGVSMPIIALKLTNLGPFEDIVLAFDEHVNVFAGPNNSGKSTTLTALGHLIVYPFALPRKLLRQAPAAFTIRFVGNNCSTKELRGVLPLDQEAEAGQEAWENMLQELGYTAFVPALRQSTGFRALGATAYRSTRRPGGDEAQAHGLAKAHNDRHHLSDTLRRRRALFPSNAGLIRDDIAIESLVELNARAHAWNDPALYGIIAQVAEIASEVTHGFPMQFLRVVEDEDGLVPLFRTPDGDVPFNVLSQGTQSVMQWLTYLLAGYAKFYGYPSNLAEQPGVVLIDEIDAHLHPASQRRIIPALRQRFPKLQIFCSTHSPLMLAGLKTSQMQLLKRDDNGRVTVSRSETDIVGWSSDEILRGLLGVANPTDLETDSRIGRLQELQRRESLSGEETAEIEHLRNAVHQTLFGAPHVTPIPQAPDRVEESPATLASAPKAKVAKKSRAKRGTGKTTPTATARRSSRAKK
jgi:energy-coupling factor transporter ATP-binding protein EcfA2